MVTALFLLFSTLAWTADILDFRLVKDGSIEPPGDRLTLSALLLPGETELQYEVRPREVLASGEHVGVRGSANSANREAGGDLVFHGTLTRKAGTNHLIQVEQVLAIAYQEIDLSDGVHAIYYEAAVTAWEAAQPKPSVVVATRLTQVTVGEGIRESITRAKPSDPVVSKEWREVRAYSMDSKGNVQEGVTQVPATTVSAAAFEPETVKVAIPGKFERKEISGRPVLPTVALSTFTPDRLRIVRFATNRKPVDAQSLKKGFTSALGALTYGTCTVNIPVSTHKKGQLKTSGWFGSNPKTDFLIELILRKNEVPFFTELSSIDKLLYVHGYRNKFDDAILTAAQLQHDIEFGGKVIAFSWPSNGTATGYWDDEKKALDSVEALAEVLEKLIRQSESNSYLNIVAHSLGNRVTLYALNKLIMENRLDPDTRVIRNLVLAAPDVDINVFMSLIGRISKIAQRISFYYSSKDVALWMSSKEHPMNRAGSHPTFFPGMDTISVDNVNSGFFRHGYFTTSDRVLLDLKLDIVRGLGAQHRQPPLNRVEHLNNFPGFPHFSFVPN